MVPQLSIMSFPVDNLLDISIPDELFLQMNFGRSLLDVPYDLVENELKRPNDHESSNNISIDSQALQDEILHFLHEYSDDSVGSVANYLGDIDDYVGTQGGGGGGTGTGLGTGDRDNETIYPKSYMNGYIKFVMDSTNAILEPMEGTSFSNERELTHEEVLEIFEATCKEIDEWKSLNDASLIRGPPESSLPEELIQQVLPSQEQTFLNESDLSTIPQLQSLVPYFSSSKIQIPFLINRRSTSSDSNKTENHLQLSLSLPIDPISNLNSNTNSNILLNSNTNSNSYSNSNSNSPTERNKSPRKRKLDNRTFYKNSRLNFSLLDIVSKPDYQYSIQLSNQSSKIPNAYQCLVLNEKLISPINCSTTCRVQRTLYMRDSLDELTKKHFHGEYEITPNQNFKKTSYEAQYILTKLDKSGKPDNTTRAGLCPYCEKIEFFGLKNSSYGNHLAYKHGILTNGNSVPDPKFYGRYKFKKGEYDEPEKKKRKTNAHILEREGVLCTSCWQILEVNCTSRSSVLGHYLRHFRDSHVGNKKENSKPDTEDSLSTFDPVVFEFINKWR